MATLYSINGGAPTALPHRYTKSDGLTATAEHVIPAMQADGLTVVVASAAPAVEWYEVATWDGTAWSVQSKPLAEVQAASINALRQRFRQARDAGTTVDFGGGPVAVLTDPTSKAAVESLLGDLERRVAAGEANPTQDFATASYAVVRGCTVAMAAAMREAVAAHWRAVWATDADHGEAIQAATTVQAVAAVDITTGWPA